MENYSGWAISQCIGYSLRSLVRTLYNKNSGEAITPQLLSKLEVEVNHKLKQLLDSHVRTLRWEFLLRGKKPSITVVAEGSEIVLQSNADLFEILTELEKDKI